MANSHWICKKCGHEVDDDDKGYGFTAICECGEQMVWRFKEYFLRELQSDQIYEQ